MRMIIIKSTSTLVGDFLMPLTLSSSPALKTPVQTAQQSAPGRALSGEPPAGGVNSTEILRGEKAVAIHHNGLTYRLQATRLGKLILTK
jgi:hemin uptake protein HemP